MDGSYIANTSSYVATTGSSSSEDRSSLPDMVTTAGVGYRPRGAHAVSGFAGTITESTRPLRQAFCNKLIPTPLDRAVCPLLALSGHRLLHCTCPLSGVSGHDFLRPTCLLLTQSGH